MYLRFDPNGEHTEVRQKFGALYFCREIIYIEMKIYQSLEEAQEPILQSMKTSQRGSSRAELLSTEEVRLRVRRYGGHSVVLSTACLSLSIRTKALPNIQSGSTDTSVASRLVFSSQIFLILLGEVSVHLYVILFCFLYCLLVRSYFRAITTSFLCL